MCVCVCVFSLCDRGLMKERKIWLKLLPLLAETDRQTDRQRQKGQSERKGRSEGEAQRERDWEGEREGASK